MALRNDELNEIMAKSRAERQALFGPVAEISRRLQPGHLVDVTTRYAKDKVAGVFGGVSNAIKENGGTAAAVALSAVAVFDAGRKSAEGGNHLGKNAPASDSHTLNGGTQAGRVSVPDVETARKAITNLARAKVLAESAGGLFIGHVIGRSFKPTGKERELFGKVGEVQNAAAEFITQHSRGAKLAAAQAFGFARYSAGLLVLMAAVGDYFDSSKDGGDQH